MALNPRIEKLTTRLAEAKKHFAIKRNAEIGRYITELELELRPLVRDRQRYLPHAGRL